MLKTKTALSLFLALTATAMAFAPLTSAETSPAKGYHVSYNPSDLNRPEHAEDVIFRVHSAATDLCFDEIGPERNSEKLKVQRCLREVTQDLVDKIGHPNLDAAHKKHPAPRKLIKRPTRIQWAGKSYSAP